jgi:hypothetical protein
MILGIIRQFEEAQRNDDDLGATLRTPALDHDPKLLG